MPELMFVLKSFIIAVIFLICLQIKIGNSTIEQKAEHWAQNSTVAEYVQNVSSGAVLVVRNGASVVTEYVSKTFGNNSSALRAGRLNFNFKRSDKFKNEQVDKEDREGSRY